MPIALEYLATDRPALPAAAEYLLARYVVGTRADLRRAIVVLPGSRAGRRLLEILVDASESRGLLLTPPWIETVGKLPEQLYRPKRPFASEITQRLVWAETVRAAPSEVRARVIPHPPAAEDLAQWLELGELLRRQHVELAADGLDFQHVVKSGQQVEGFTESERWRALDELQQAYLRRLDALELWDLQTARLVALQKQECATDRDIVLVTTVDMNVTLRKMLDQVADRVTALVYTPAAWRDRFDRHGCLIPERWAEVEIPIHAEQVTVADGPDEQADGVVAFLASLDGKFPADDIVIGLPDEQLVPDMRRALAAAGVATRWGPGQPLSQSPPLQLLRTVARYLDQSYFADFAALVRHTDVGRWLTAAGVGGSLLDDLDRFHQDVLPYRLQGSWTDSATGYDAVMAAWRSIEQLVQCLRQPPLPLAQWGEHIYQLLVTVYGDRDFDRQRPEDRAVLAACDAVRDLLRLHREVPEPLTPRVSASEAIRWLLDDAQRTTTPDPVDAGAIELLGWLELTLDDAPVAVVTSFNEGFVPSSVNSDLFLPNSLRQRLGILDNERRYARDAYSVSILAESRQKLHFLVARRNRDGDPLAPSRLLFATDPETAARRALAFFRPPRDPRQPVSQATTVAEPSLVVPQPRPLTQPMVSLSVTSFRDYLACPYRFYLRHVLKLAAVDDAAEEMDGRAFGNLAHDVLRQFGVSSHRDSTDPEQIAAILRHELNQRAARRYGRSPLPTVLVQVEQLRIRLEAFARAQAEWARQGWRIEHTEVPQSRQDAAQLLVDGTPMRLTGRIDRIDILPATGERIIWDYKTSDGGETPDKTHRKGDAWIDLQLPLYRHLAAALGIDGPVRLGYILLPKDTGGTGMCPAEWSDAELAAADETACEVVRAIRQEKFWPPAIKPPAFAEDFAPICQDQVLKSAVKSDTGG